MKKLMKRIGAVLMAVAMMAALGVSGAFAVDHDIVGAVPSSSDKGTISVSGIPSGATVNAYKIVKADYTSNGFTGYSTVTGVTLEDVAAPTQTEIVTIAKNLMSEANAEGHLNLTAIPMIYNSSTSSYEATNQDVGEYVVVVTANAANDKKQYNPMVASIYYTQNGKIADGSVSAGGTWQIGETTGYAKSKEPTVDKEITDGTEADGDKETVSLGSVVSYKVNVTLPEYPADAVNKTAYIADEMSAGLTFIYDSLSITYGTNQTATRTESNGVYTFSIGEGADTKTIATAQVSSGSGKGNGFNLSFVYENVKDLTNLVVTYNGVVNSNAVIGNDATQNKNTVDYWYANNPTKGSTYENITNNPDQAEATDLLKKEDEETVYTYQIAFQKVGKDGETTAPLADAVFGIYTDAACTNLIDVVKTNSSGYASTTQVQKGDYFIKELVAPNGWSLNTDVYKISAQWTSATTTMTKTTTTFTYTTVESEKVPGSTQAGWILVKTGETTGTFYKEKNPATAPDGYEWKAAYVKDSNETSTTATTTTTGEAGAGTATTMVDVTKDNAGADNIVDTKTPNLPSTGGIGTYVFTVAGVAIMAIAAGLLIVRHKKKAE